MLKQQIIYPNRTPSFKNCNIANSSNLHRE